MHFEDLFEPIEVLSHFKDGKLIPLRFKWNGRSYKIVRINGQWRTHQGYAQQYHFSVSSETPDCFELIFDTGDFTWQLARVCMDG
ncbi:MAG: hypothetical protein Kow00108_26200 [Calditrichia bacterium]